MLNNTFYPALSEELPPDAALAMARSLSPRFRHFLSEKKLPPQLESQLAGFYLPLVAWLAGRATAGKPLMVGVNGAQGSGKSTLCCLLTELLPQVFQKRCCLLSIDDLYLTKAERQGLAAMIHPLLGVRGVPGTHDVGLGLELFRQLQGADEQTLTLIPRFDKAVDDRAPRLLWNEFEGRPDIILFEGWCVGAKPQEKAALSTPVNALEEQEDPAGYWRHYVNERLAGDYQQLFAQLDLLLMLKIPEWQMVKRWRGRQEEQLAAQRQGVGRGIMPEAELERFLRCYQRLTLHQLAEMPDRADLVFVLNAEQQVTRIIKKATS